MGVGEREEAQNCSRKHSRASLLATWADWWGKGAAADATLAEGAFTEGRVA